MTLKRERSSELRLPGDRLQTDHYISTRGCYQSTPMDREKEKYKKDAFERNQYYLLREKPDNENAYELMKWKQFHKQEQQRRRKQDIIIKEKWLKMEGKKIDENVVPAKDPELEGVYSESEYEWIRIQQLKRQEQQGQLHKLDS